jgi:hypothetical protein
MWESKRGAIENGERIEKGTCVADDDVLEEVGVRHLCSSSSGAAPAPRTGVGFRGFQGGATRRARAIEQRRGFRWGRKKEGDVVT